jgi:hypothetical protein
MGDKDHWNTARWHAPAIMGGLVVFVIGLIIVSMLGGKKDSSGPVALKVAPPTPSPLVERAAVAGGKADAPAPASAASAEAAVPAPTPTPAVVRSPGGNASIALPADEDRALVALPSFIPPYPGSRTISCNLSASAESSRGSYVFATPDGPDVVGSYYKDEFASEGLVVSINVGGNDRKNVSFTLIADGGAAGRSVSLRVDYQEGRSHASLGFVGK